jgi:hypothetical protein
MQLLGTKTFVPPANTGNSRRRGAASRKGHAWQENVKRARWLAGGHASYGGWLMAEKTNTEASNWMVPGDQAMIETQRPAFTAMTEVCTRASLQPTRRGLHTSIND